MKAETPPLTLLRSEDDSDEILNRLWKELPIQVRESLLGALSRILVRQLCLLLSTKEDPHVHSKSD
jgi:hypothetical protein